jgi:hypothetical protein
MTKPITPDEAMKFKKKALPEEVIQSFNELIAVNFDGKESCFIQSAIVRRIREKIQLDGREVFPIEWLDVEDIYEDAGWIVTYDKPSYVESYASTFTFRRKS